MWERKPPRQQALLREHCWLAPAQQEELIEAIEEELEQGSRRRCLALERAVNFQWVPFKCAVCISHRFWLRPVSGHGFERFLDSGE